MKGLGLLIAGLFLVGLVLFLIILGFREDCKIKRKFKKDVEELKIGNKYKMKKSFLCSDNPFKVDPTFIVEITDIKFNHKNEIYVQYKQIEPEYKGKPFSEPFKDFIDFFELIK